MGTCMASKTRLPSSSAIFHNQCFLTSARFWIVCDACRNAFTQEDFERRHYPSCMRAIDITQVNDANEGIDTDNASSKKGVKYRNRE